MSTDTQPAVTIHIGNTDNRLTQQRWAKFCNDLANVVDAFVDVYSAQGARLIGMWYALPNSEYQSAVCTLQLPASQTDGARGELVDMLGKLASRYEQDSIGCQWAPDTEFLEPAVVS